MYPTEFANQFSDFECTNKRINGAQGNTVGKSYNARERFRSNARRYLGGQEEAEKERGFFFIATRNDTYIGRGVRLPTIILAVTHVCLFERVRFPCDKFLERAGIRRDVIRVKERDKSAVAAGARSRARVRARDFSGSKFQKQP